MKKIFPIKLKLFLSFFLLMVFFSGCSALNVDVLSESLTIEANRLPPDMAKEDFKLAVALPHGKKQENKVRAIFESYKGKCMLLTRLETSPKVTNPRKCPKDEYRYIIGFHIVDYTLQSYDLEDTVVKAASFFLLDRKTNKEYILEGKAEFNYIKALEAHVIAINRVLDQKKATQGK
jgi:hypothetical protein